MSKRILIVDDSPLVLSASGDALVAAGFDVVLYSSVDELGEKGADGFDLILIDVNMPELFGDDVASVLRLEREVTTRIYLFSTMPEDELRERVLEARVDGYIAKGPGVDHLVSEVHAILG